MSPLSDRITTLLVQWEESVCNETELTPEELCTEHPELLAELKLQIDRLKKMAWMSATGGESLERSPVVACSIGDVLSERYEIANLIGYGGFGEVYQALDLQLKRNVAIKIARQDRLPLSEHLIEEAQKVAKLSHPSIVPIYDVCRCNEQVYLVSEFIKGQSLAHRIAAKDYSIDEAITWLIEIGNAIQFAHANGIIHRDIKPSNILIDENNVAKITDFGIAIESKEAREVAMHCGSPGYIAPELIDPDVCENALSERSDIFALGMVLAEAIAGSHIFEGKNGYIDNARPRPKKWSEVPIRHRRILERCLAYRPRDRYETVKCFVDDLRRATKRLKVVPVALITAASTLLIGTILYGYFPGFKPSPIPDNRMVSSDNPTITEPNSEQESPYKDLLKLVIIRRDVIRGSWEFNGEHLVGSSPLGNKEQYGGAIQIAYRPEGDYTLRLRARRIGSVAKHFVLPIVHSDHQIDLQLGGGLKETNIGVLKETSNQEVDFFPDNEYHTITMRVDTEGVLVTGDSGQRYEFRGFYNNLRSRPYDIPDAKGLFLKVYGTYEIAEFTIEE